MNHSHLEAIGIVRKLCLRLGDSAVLGALDVTVHPSFVALRSVQTVLESEESRILLGAQNCHTEDSGAFTGEVSPAMLAKLNVSYVIVGHSERRQHFGEDDSLVRAKCDAVLRHRMTPIACVGETERERAAGDTETRVTTQVKALVSSLPSATAERLVIAYEPVWAIGTGNVAGPQDAQSVASLIRDTARAEWGPSADRLRVLYGGSVKPSNAAEMTAQADVDGLLVGGASLDPDEFAQVVSEAGTSC